MKRFTETGKWMDVWFRKLEPKIKLLYQYILDTCDHAGVFEFDADTASHLIGLAVVDEDLKSLGDRISKLPNGRWAIVKFIPFQYGELSTECRPHKVVFDAIRKNNLQYPIGYPIKAVSDTAQDKDKDQDKEKDAGMGGAGGKDNKPTSPRALLVARLFRRGPNAKWSDKEIASFKKLKDHPDSEFEEVAEFYDKSGYEYLCTGLQAFLNNFTTQLDRARQWKAGRLNGNGSNGHSGNGTHPVKRIQSAAEAYGG